jgi:hypothetical protein
LKSDRSKNGALEGTAPPVLRSSNRNQCRLDQNQIVPGKFWGKLALIR